MQIKVDKRGLERAEKTMHQGAKVFAKATVSAGFELRGRIKEGMKAQAPAGEAWPAAHPWTRHGSLRNIWGWRRRGSKTTWSATRYMRKRTRMSLGGDKRPLARLVNAVRLRQEWASSLGSQSTSARVRIGFLGRRSGFLAGYHAEAHAQRVTPRMRRFLFAAGLGIRAGSLKIPARPAVEPVYRRYGGRVPAFVRSRVAAALAGQSGQGIKL